MKIIAFADTHTQHERLTIPEGDILIFAGDISGSGELHEIKRFNEWLGRLSHKYKFVIPGNHDRNFATNPETKGMINNAFFMMDQEFSIDGIKFYFSPWAPQYEDWPLMKERGPAIKLVWDKIPEDTNVLVTHGPPCGILDKCLDDSHPGCEELLKVVNRIKPKIHIFGHIHKSGAITIGETSFYNVSVLDHSFNLCDEPMIIDY